ncbi:MAG TPA: GNAT family N-acetyltransferase [Stackebrandtia sp.]|jgi:ribosomal protein S18 acetylase RimI-like enzyme|uniref:GNAT family N-acetyltransferase n=1 Tax=Stackebrandtia sp. TaxID=2023065 RepID=UPI002D63B0F8|nr:GNAT family N-acetyltransferase [Stackebrandtia sp.]HZE38393.1 GNAT family N-acetyltransferase [Stackebrandtia sp.]
MLALAPGYHARPATGDDVDAIHAVEAASQLQILGRVETDRDDIVAVFARDGIDLAADTVVVADPTGAPAAWAWVNRRSDVTVHPEHRGRGLGGALLEWAENRARDAGTAAIVQSVPDLDAAATALVRAHGYRPKVTSWMLGIDTDGQPPAEAGPVTIRAYDPADGAAAHRVTQDAFADWNPRRLSYQEWARHTVGRSSFAPWASPMAFDGDALVGAAIGLMIPERGEGYIESLAVSREHRGRGIATALLRHAFAAFAAHGHRHCTLWTHSDTGALALYQRVGMAIERATTVWSKALSDPPPRSR